MNETTCPCCFVIETGGFPCVRCERARKCAICLECIHHHHENCGGDVWAEYMELLAGLRARHGIHFVIPAEVEG